MIILNFSHPLIHEQLAQLECLTGRAIEDVRDEPAHFENDHDYGPQATALVDQCELSAREWQTESILIVPPALNAIAVLVIAELHGRMGYFPPCVRLRLIEGSLPIHYEVAEVLDLQAQRDEARQRRREDSVQ
jgi:hypothetical protein